MSTSPRFTWKSADGANHEFEMTTAEIAVGRAPTCDIVLPDDQMVSRRHAIFRRQGDVVTVVDLGSSNGTLINGVEIHDAATLKENDKVTIGDQDLVYYEPQAVPVSAFGAPSYNNNNAPSYSAPSYNSNGGNGATYAPMPEQPSYMNAPTPPPFFMPTSEPVPVAAAPTPYTVEQDTGAVGTFNTQSHGSYVHTVNGQEVEREEANYRNQGQMAVASEQQRPDAAALMASIQQLHAQLSDQLQSSTTAADSIRSGIRDSLSQLDNALNAAQSTTQQYALADLQQLANSVSQTQRMDLAASFASRANELSDVLTAHTQLMNALNAVRSSLVQALNR